MAAASTGARAPLLAARADAISALHPPWMFHKHKLSRQAAAAVSLGRKREQSAV